MSLRKIGFFILSLAIVILSCKKDDDDDGGSTVIEVRDRGEQQEIDNDLILEYLNSHYYNEGALTGLGPDAGIQDVIISDTKVDDDYVLLMTKAVKETVTFRETIYEYYVLEINPGGGSESPTFADSVQILYQGSLMDASVFDFKFFPDKNLFDLTGVIEGWRNVIPKFNVAERVDLNENGSVDYYNSGLGIMFLPSGLAYFSNATTDIPGYSPLIFKFELLQYFENDHDSDGIPSYLDVGVNAENETINTLDELGVIDTDGDNTPDFIDADDDGDGILTINEDIDKDGDPTNDIGANGIPNYLDENETESKNDL